MTQEEFKSSVRAGLNGWYSSKQYEDDAVERICSVRDQFRKLLGSVHRDGIPSLLDYLDECGFYYRPSSARRHHNYPGGLAEHCLGVYKQMARMPVAKQMPDSVKVVGLLHDMCKCDQFRFEGRAILSKKVSGHGSRSIRIIKQCGVQLDEYEYRAIRYHMRRSASQSRRSDPQYDRAVSEPLRRAVCKADTIDATVAVLRDVAFHQGRKH
jgi:hypothetical protein